jgi:hypothetical protein
MDWNGFQVPNTCQTVKLDLACNCQNEHKRDKNIIFDEVPHVYYIKGVSNYTSATNFIHEHFSEFDKVRIATNMTGRSDFESASKYQKYQTMLVDTEGHKVCKEVLVNRIIESWDKLNTVHNNRLTEKNAGPNT